MYTVLFNNRIYVQNLPEDLFDSFPLFQIQNVLCFVNRKREICIGT